eukprot:12917691-Prorocentrum_lima.AAC.1
MAQGATCPGVGIHCQPSQTPLTDYSDSGDNNNPMHAEGEKENQFKTTLMCTFLMKLRILMFPYLL